VVTLTDELQTALADADGARLASVAVPWSHTEEFFGQGDPQILAGLLHELAELARRARNRGERLYCWVCAESLRRCGRSASALEEPAGWTGGSRRLAELGREN